MKHQALLKIKVRKIKVSSAAIFIWCFKGKKNHCKIIYMSSAAVFEENVEVLSKPFSRYLLETQTSCLLSNGEPIPVGEVILKIFIT